MEEEMPKKHRKGMKRYLMIGVIGLALAWAAPAMATNIVTFDPTGTAGPGGDITIDRLDQAPGNAIALGASANSAVGTNFRLLYQSNLGTAQLANVNVYSNGGLGHFFTFVAGFGETVTQSSGGASPLLAFGFNAADPVNFFNTNQVLPFLEIDPSACFSSNGIANCDQPGVSSVGAVNGFTGPNTMFQADANESFQTTEKTPEPMSLTLLGLGLLGLAGLRRIRLIKH